MGRRGIETGRPAREPDRGVDEGEEKVGEEEGAGEGWEVDSGWHDLSSSGCYRPSRKSLCRSVIVVIADNAAMVGREGRYLGV